MIWLISRWLKQIQVTVKWFWDPKWSQFCSAWKRTGEKQNSGQPVIIFWLFWTTDSSLRPLRLPYEAVFDVSPNRSAWLLWHLGRQKKDLAHKSWSITFKNLKIWALEAGFRRWFAIDLARAWLWWSSLDDWEAVAVDPGMYGSGTMGQDIQPGPQFLGFEPTARYDLP